MEAKYQRKELIGFQYAVRSTQYAVRSTQYAVRSTLGARSTQYGARLIVLGAQCSCSVLSTHGTRTQYSLG